MKVAVSVFPDDPIRPRGTRQSGRITNSSITTSSVPSKIRGAKPHGSSAAGSFCADGAQRRKRSLERIGADAV